MPVEGGSKPGICPSPRIFEKKLKLKGRKKYTAY
jgi:hypothetical protein